MSATTAAVKPSLAPRWRGPFQALALVVGFVLLSYCLRIVAPALNPALTGFVVVLTSLATHLLPLRLVEDGAKFLIAQSALFLIPPVVAVARQSALLQAHWLPLLAIVVGGTTVSAAATAIAVELTARSVARGRK